MSKSFPLIKNHEVNQVSAVVQAYSLTLVFGFINMINVLSGTIIIAIDNISVREQKEF